MCSFTRSCIILVNINKSWTIRAMSWTRSSLLMTFLGLDVVGKQQTVASVSKESPGFTVLILLAFPLTFCGRSSCCFWQNCPFNLCPSLKARDCFRWSFSNNPRHIFKSLLLVCLWRKMVNSICMFQTVPKLSNSPDMICLLEWAKPAKCNRKKKATFILTS